MLLSVQRCVRPMGEGWMKAAEIFNVTGLATLVTGAASGIGLAYSEVMAANGARVAMLDKDDAALASAVAQLRGAGYDVHGATVDVTDRAALRLAFDTAAQTLGALDVVFANAGIAPGPGF